MSTTPNMSLLLPIPTITPGPTYASENNDAFEVIDAHDHTSGKGVPVPANGININNDLPFNGFNASVLRATQFQSQGSPLTLPSDLSMLYVQNGNLFYVNQIGQQVQITSGAALDATSIGGIGGDYATSTALLFYTSLDRTFTFWSNTNVPANIDAGAITIREITTSPNGITIQSPLSLPASYSLTLPSALPGGTTFLTLDNAGNIIPAPSVSGGITNSYLAANSVDTPQLVDGSVTEAKLGPANYVIGTPVSGNYPNLPFPTVGNTGITATLTTHGRPVLVQLIVAPIGTEAFMSSDTPGDTWHIYLNIDTFVTNNQYRYLLTSDGVTGVAPPPSSMNWLVPGLSAGSHTFTLYYNYSNGSAASWTVANIALSVIEL